MDRVEENWILWDGVVGVLGKRPIFSSYWVREAGCKDASSVMYRNICDEYPVNVFYQPIVTLQRW